MVGMLSVVLVVVVMWTGVFSSSLKTQTLLQRYAAAAAASEVRISWTTAGALSSLAPRPDANRLCFEDRRRRFLLGFGAV